ncbi:hypothetical protein HGRIS_005148 [Hohenbuehelia grisea]|uniref:Uncharacterized protein n=1 Tax=Hohenbuehelia grisea TaxID=104357 RepID=A0ABR3JE34_9AGAR
MIRGEWKTRSTPKTTSIDATMGVRNGNPVDDDSDEEQTPSDSVDDDSDVGMDVGEATPRSRPSDNLNGHGPHTHSNNSGIDSLADTMSSLSLVPPSIRFGRGGKRGGFQHQYQHPHLHQQHPQHPGHTVNGANDHHNLHTHTSSANASSPDEHATPRQHQQALPPRGHALGPRGGRGRAGFNHHATNGHHPVAMNVDVSNNPQAMAPPNMRGRGAAHGGARGRGRGRGRGQTA